MLKEYQIENALLELFNASGLVVYKNYDQAQKIGDSYRKHKYQMRGVADISILTPDGVVFVEVKTPKGVLSAFQKKFEGHCKGNGIKYFVARSLSDGKEILKQIKS